MAIQIGDAFPDFTLPGTNGDFTLSTTQAGKPLVLFFYPGDFTPICTAEACSFRDGFTELKNIDVDVLGISPDSIETHHKFRAAYKLPFHLLSDPKHTVANKIGYTFLAKYRRVTFLLNAEHKVVAKYENFFAGENHFLKMIEALKAS